MAKRIFIIAGETSGDAYGAALIEALKKLDPAIEVVGLGGDKMAAAGMRLLYNLVREFSVMGFLPVLLGIPKVMRFLEIIVDYIDHTPPDLVVLIDYPGFNLYFATYTRRRNIPTVYYITPQIWAWAPWRIKKIKRLLLKMLVIFPFEVPFYRKAGIQVEYVGHPLMDRISQFHPDENFRARYQLTEKKIFALLPGSREHQIRLNLPVMLWVVHELCKAGEDFQACLGLASTKHLPLIEDIIQKTGSQLSLPTIHMILHDTYNLIHYTHCAIVVSGTACLETALLGTPQVIIYRVPKLDKWLVEHTSFLQCEYFTLPNIISGKQIVPEHLVADTSPQAVLQDILLRWRDTPQRQECLTHLHDLRTCLGESGASEQAARAILNELTSVRR